MEIVRLLLPVSDPQAHDSSALLRAAQNGHLEVVELLLPLSDPKAGNSCALHLAAEAGHMGIVRSLLPVSDPKAHDSWALQWAAQSGHLEIVKLLLPLSDISKIMLDSNFVKASGCDLLLSCLPSAKAKGFVADYPDIAFPRTRAMLAAQALGKRPAAATVAQRRRA